MKDDLKLLQYPDDVLTVPAARVTVFDDELRRLAHGMVNLMYAEKGIGLAAPQVGESKRLIVADWSSHEDVGFTFAQILVNPVITFRSPETEVGPEGCLSIPGVTVDVERSLMVRCEYQDLQGNPQKCEAVGLPARVLQHEVDHLDGTVMLDYLKRASTGSVAVPTGEVK